MTLQLSSEWGATDESKKINWSSTFMDDIKSPVSLQRKISNISCTFSIFNDDHYLKALNYHLDNGLCTRGNNHLQLSTIATQVTYKRDNLFHLLKHVNKTTKYYLYIKDIADTDSNIGCSTTKAHPNGLFD